jgi:hypothetical protein
MNEKQASNGLKKADAILPHPFQDEFALIETVMLLQQ